MEPINVFYETWENWLEVDPLTHETRVERRNVQPAYGRAIATIVRAVPTGFGTAENVTFFVVERPDGGFDEVRVSECKHLNQNH